MFKDRLGIFTRRSKPRLTQAFRIVCLLACISLLLLSGCGGGGGDPGTSPGGSVGSGPGKATVSWEAPTTNADETDLTDLAGYKIYYGTTSPISKENSQPVIVNDKDTTTYTITGLDQGTYYFAVTAYDFYSNESELSGEVSKVVTGI